MLNTFSEVILKCLCLVYLVTLTHCQYEEDPNNTTLRAFISQHGLRGEIDFTNINDTTIQIRTKLTPTLQFPDQVWRWTIHAFPVDYRELSNSRCSDENLGEELIDLTEELGYLIIPGKENTEYESVNRLTGDLGLWGRSIVLENAERDRIICSSIVAVNKPLETYAQAKFSSPIGGLLNFRFLSPNKYDDSDAFILADLYHTRTVTEKVPYTEHKWKLYVTDIFDADKGNHEDNCNVLQLVFDPKNSEDGMSVGDLDNALGLIKVATDPNAKRTKTMFKKEIISSLREEMATTKRSLYVVIFDHRHPDSFFACAKLRLIQPKSAKVYINMSGIRGFVHMEQPSPFDPTWMQFSVTSAQSKEQTNVQYVMTMERYSIRELPWRRPEHGTVKNMCATVGDIYNPTKIIGETIPPAGMGSQDQYPVGDVLGKHKDNHHNALTGLYWDLFLPLNGVHSVMHRTMLFERHRPAQDACGIIHSYEYGTPYETQMSSAEVVFRYPIVGRVIFRQPLGRHWEDTTIIIETMVHADGANVNSTFEHRWAINEHAPGKDFYNWTGRCLSAGKIYEPYALDTDARHPEAYCRPGLEAMCKLGDLSTRHGTLGIAGRKSESPRLTRRLFTDTMVALSGRYSIMRRSLVIYDDHGPVARGERMACSIVNGLNHRKAVVREWFGNGEPVSVVGRLEVTQQSEYDLANLEFRLEGLEDIGDFAIHVTPVERDLDFPCEKSSLLDVFNPFNVSKNGLQLPGQGTPDQFPVGALGHLVDQPKPIKQVFTFYNDTLLSLFGPYSILGRSMILHRFSRVRRWACSSIERGYSPSEGRELRAIASFHHPNGFAYGYIRVTQLVHNDGSYSDAVIEVKLRHPGVRDRNHTLNHKWEIFVNPVGVDATVKVTNTRCVAGGYRWNPYFNQLADPLNHELYRQECGADNPLRCDAGDLTSRLGPISLGGERQMFMDSNLPLEGPVSAMGRAIVIFGPKGSSERFACANLEPDSDTIKYFNIMKPPSFILRSFLDEVRQVMGVPEWMLGVDSRRSREMHHGSCLQILLHFMGPHANKLEYDFSSLMASGQLDAPSIYIPGYINPKRKRTIGYRMCEITDPAVKKKKSSFFSGNGSSGVCCRVVSLLSWVLAVIVIL